MDKGPWVARRLFERTGKDLKKNGWCVASDDFEHDVTLEIHGDFANDQWRKDYAEWLADRLNR